MNRGRLAGKFLVVAALLYSLAGCESDYEKRVREGLKSGIRKDTLFLGLTLGMSSKDFYARCWELNKKQVIRQGTANTSVLWRLAELKDSADMNFYPSFERDSIFEMRARINYRGWAPWNKELLVDTLMVDVVKMLKRWYKNDFIKIDYQDIGTVYVAVDGNRRIAVSKEGEAEVKVLFTDMLVETSRKKEKQDHAAN